MALFRRCVLLSLLICLGCSAQSAPSDVDLHIERQVRSFYEVAPDVKIVVGPRKPSDFPNYDLVTVTFSNSEKQKAYDFLLSKDEKTLIRLTKFDLSKDPYAEVMKKIDVDGRPVRGNKNAKVVAVNYDDYECPYCSHLHETLFPELFKEYGDRVEFIYKDFPLAEMHPWATHAAVDANCVAAQNGDAYWGFVDYIHTHQHDVSSVQGQDGQFAELDRLAVQQAQQHNLDPAKLQACIKAQNQDAIKASLKEGAGIGVDSTPTLFINGEKMDGARPIAELRAVLDRALQQAGVAPPPHPEVSSGSPASDK